MWNPIKFLFTKPDEKEDPKTTKKKPPRLAKIVELNPPEYFPDKDENYEPDTPK